MSEVTQEQIIAAIKQIANGEALSKKPNVKEIEKITGDITQAQRDEAFKAYLGGLEADSGDGQSDVDTNEEVKPDHPVVTNESDQTLSIKGVKILPGSSVPVPKFDADHSVIRRWIDSGVISV